MPKFTCLAFFLMACCIVVCAQDEGTIVKRERIDKSNNIFVDFGPSFTLGKNIGDYSVGFSIEAGYQKRLNRVFSIGPSFSYLSFEYDPEVTNVSGNAYVGAGDPSQWDDKYGVPGLSYTYGYVLSLEGGNLSLISLALNLKLNFVPIKDNTKFSVYGFAKPFISYAMRGAVNGTDERYTYETFEDVNGTLTYPNDDQLYIDLDDDTFYPDQVYNDPNNPDNKWGPVEYQALEESNEVTGGIFIGPGVELFPTKGLSFFLQAAFGYTFPVTFISTEAYEPTVTDYVKEDFPMVKKGFPSVNIQFGLSFNF
jgi:hypothetical protein